MARELVRAQLERREYTAIAQRAAADKRVLSDLLALTYAADDLIGWRAVKALGLAAECVAASDLEFVRNILRRLLWSLNDESGSIGWRAPQALGAIIARQPRRLAEFVPLLVSLFDLDETHFYPGILWAIGHVAERDADLIRLAAPRVRAFLADPDPATRGLAAWCLGLLGERADLPALEARRDDAATLRVFANDNWVERTVGELARDALTRLSRR